MRTLTTAQSAVLDLNHRAHHIKIEIDQTGFDTWVDLTNLYGFNWVIGASLTEAIDQPVATLTATLRHRIHNLSMNPFMATSPINTGGVLAQPYQRIRMSTATTGQYMTARSTDYVLVFRGRIWKVDWGNETIEIEARDEGGDLQDLWIETTRPYGSDAGVAVETVTQSILTDNTTNVTLWSKNGDGTPAFDAGDTPGWDIKPLFNQQEMSVLDAVRRLWVDQIGWDVRFKWQATAADFKLVAYEPQRTAPSSARTFTADQYTVEAVSLSNADVRNVVRVVFVGAGNRDGTKIDVFDSASILKYGRKFMQLDETNTKQIDTSTEATTLANNMLSDLKDPVVTLSIKVMYWFAVELNDYYTVATNGVHFSADQTLAVQGFTHDFGEGMATTTLHLSGLPKSGLNSYIAKGFKPVLKALGGTVKHGASAIAAGKIRNSTFTMWTNK